MYATERVYKIRIQTTTETTNQTSTHPLATCFACQHQIRILWILMWRIIVKIDFVPFSSGAKVIFLSKLSIDFQIQWTKRNIQPMEIEKAHWSTKDDEKKAICVKNYNFIDHTAICLSTKPSWCLFSFNNEMILIEKKASTQFFFVVNFSRSASWIMADGCSIVIYFIYYSLKASQKKENSM